MSLWLVLHNKLKVSSCCAMLLICFRYSETNLRVYRYCIRVSHQVIWNMSQLKVGALLGGRVGVSSLKASD